ncbi:MAG: agglutinin biogenesis protein MshI [Rhodocyclales bacterium]|nr:agglutinin biogenesis protein MshI [Rhodocyclales bacterium]
MFKVFKPKIEQGWLSVVIGEKRVDFAHIRRERDARPVLLLADSIEKSGDEAGMLGALKRPMHLERYRCTTLLGRGKYQLIQTEGINAPADEAREMMRWKLKDQLEFPVENAAVDLLLIPSDGRTAQVFAAIAPERSVAPLVQAFQSAGLVLAAIDLPEMSQRNLAALFENGNLGLATLIFDDDEGLLTFTAKGELLVARHVEISARQLLAADEQRRTALFERIALDVQRSLDNFDRLNSAISLERLLVSPIPGLDGFIDHLKGNLTIAVAPLDLASVIDFGRLPGMVDPVRRFQSLRALGAALRDEPIAA